MSHWHWDWQAQAASGQPASEASAQILELKILWSVGATVPLADPECQRHQCQPQAASASECQSQPASERNWHRDCQCASASGFRFKLVRPALAPA